MANAIELITKWSSKAWDKVYKREAISSVLDGDKDLMKFTGAKTVKIARFASSGLSDYARPNNGIAYNSDGSTRTVDGVFGGDGHDTTYGRGYGYQQGDASLLWEEFTIACDRGVQLKIELFDDEETDGLAVAAATTEVSRTQVIPEVDAYVFSKLAENAGHVATGSINPSTNLGIGGSGNPIFELNAAFLALAEAEVPENDQIIFCSNTFYNAVRNTGEIIKTLRQTEYGENVKFTIGEYEGREIIPVPRNRFKTLIKLLNGGYGWEANSKDIDFIVCAKSSVYHVTKYDKVRVFNPGVVQDFDGYKVNVRVYHDVFVPMNKKPSIYVHVSGNDGPAASERTLTYAYDPATDVISNVVVSPAGDLVRGLYASEGDLAIGTKVSADVSTNKGVVLEGVATGLAADEYHLYGIENGMVVAKAAAPFTVTA